MALCQHPKALPLTQKAQPGESNKAADRKQKAANACNADLLSMVCGFSDRVGIGGRHTFHADSARSLTGCRV